MVTKADFFNSLKFERPIQKKTRKDVSITRISGKKAGAIEMGRLEFIFRNGSDEMIGDGDRMSFARFKNRLVFIKDVNGWKISKLKETKANNSYVFVSEETSARYMDFCGDYDLQYDELYEYYYIESEAVKNARN